ncbi:nucleotidyltransferase substrate binding protein [Belliella sp. R4-6]|uniref:Nucleotidyltransferase substrate binding protein n=1 Tax=Belliella alkalica TaxID=1730871 RepID=A0ABS9VG07_9BACT|nr:nucleotidyltransferase substrate binding protein [Belliella alkalica]MCH7414880.1 nucleotidyltransferase substrate binding protein [Belliella alkalica]
MKEDIRWEQRFSNFKKALKKLTDAVDFIHKNLEEDADKDVNDVLNEMIKEGLIQRFEYTHELAWNLMKDYASYQGIQMIGGSRDATREAFQLQLIENGKVWMDMIGSRNKTSHTYNNKTAEEIYFKILNEYHEAFIDFERNMESKKNGNNDQFS